MEINRLSPLGSWLFFGDCVCVCVISLAHTHTHTGVNYSAALLPRGEVHSPSPVTSFQIFTFLSRAKGLILKLSTRSSFVRSHHAESTHTYSERCHGVEFRSCCSCWWWECTTTAGSHQVHWTANSYGYSHSHLNQYVLCCFLLRFIRNG